LKKLFQSSHNHTKQGSKVYSQSWKSINNGRLDSNNHQRKRSDLL